MAVTCYEMHTYPRSKWGADGHFYGVRKLRVAWDDRADLLSELSSTTTAWPYDDGPGLAAMFPAIPREATVEPLPAKQSGSGSIASYDWAVVTVKYSTKGPVYQIAPQVWIEERVVPYAQSMRLSNSGLTWVDGTSLDAAEGPVVTFYGLDYQLTYYGLAVVPAAVLGLTGCTNIYPVTAYSLGCTFYPDCLLYCGAFLKRRISWDLTSLLWDVTYSFKSRPQGLEWNKFPRGKHGNFQYVKKSDGNILYAYTPAIFALT